MNLSTLTPAKGSRKTRHRVGRGQGSGWGKTAGRGSKGHSSRSGFTYSVNEGGQMPLHRRLPKFGFKSPFKTEYRTVAVGQLEAWSQAGKLTQDVTLDALIKAGVLTKRQQVKVLGDGELTVKLNITAHSFSESAKEKIEKAGGTTTVVVRTLDEAQSMKGADKQPMDVATALATPKPKLKRGVKKNAAAIKSAEAAKASEKKKTAKTK